VLRPVPAKLSLPQVHVLGALRSCTAGRRSAARPAAVTAPSSPVIAFEAPLRGEQKFPAPFPFLCAPHRSRELAGEADPPPSGAGRRGCPRLPPLRVALARAHVGRREPLPEAAPAKRRRAPFVPSLFRRARRRASHAHVQGRAIARGRF
jgi:hypothetical protein